MMTILLLLLSSLEKSLPTFLSFKCTIEFAGGVAIRTSSKSGEVHRREGSSVAVTPPLFILSAYSLFDI